MIDGRAEKKEKKKRERRGSLAVLVGTSTVEWSRRCLENVTKKAKQKQTLKRQNGKTCIQVRASVDAMGGFCINDGGLFSLKKA